VPWLRSKVSKMLKYNMSIAIITSLFHPYYGGAEKQLEKLAEVLLSRGVECCIVTRRSNGLKSFAILNNVPVYRVFAARKSSGLLSTLTFIMSSCLFFIFHPNITRRVQILQADSDSPGLVAVIVKSFFKKKVIIRMRGKRQLEAIKSSFFMKIVFKIISRFSDAIVIQYNQINDLRFLGVDDSKIYIIPNGVDTEYFKRSDVKIREQFREKLNLKNHVVGLYVGRIDPIKGLDLLLEALPSVVKIYPYFKLIIVGSGPYKDNLETLAKALQIDEHVMFVGSTQDVKKYYNIADIFILPSRSEGISNALLEAMSMELPVIATDVGGAHEVIDDLENGFLIPVSSKVIAQKVCQLVANNDLRCILGKKARNTIQAKFSLEKQVQKYINLYSSLVDFRKTKKSYS